MITARVSTVTTSTKIRAMSICTVEACSDASQALMPCQRAECVGALSSSDVVHHRRPGPVSTAYLLRWVSRTRVWIRIIHDRPCLRKGLVTPQACRPDPKAFVAAR